MKKEKSISIRKALPEDANKLLELNKKYNGKENINKDILSIQKILADNEKEIVFVAVSGDALIGFVCVQVYESFCYSRPTLEITELYVEKNMRRQNVATLLINEVLKFAAEENVLEINLRVSGKNEFAVKLYESTEFSKVDHNVFRIRYY